MPIRDDSLIAQYIRAIENPDSLGYKDGLWTGNSVHDNRNRGFGIDIANNKDAITLTRGREKQWLTEDEERNLRLSHLDYNEDVLNKYLPPENLLSQPISEEKKAMALGMLYRGDGIQSIVKNPTISKAFFHGSTEDMQHAVSDYYKGKSLGVRADNHNKFFNSKRNLESKAQEDDYKYIRRKEAWTPKNFADYEFKPGNKYSDGGLLNDAWNSLSLKEKAEMIRVAVKNGITSLPEVKEAYNKFADGGPKETWTLQDEVGYRQWRDKLPRNLKETKDSDYDMRAAYKAGAQPMWNEEDKSFHLSSRDPKKGRIFKAPHHPTYLEALAVDASQGYYPTMDSKGNTYTETWSGNTQYPREIEIPYRAYGGNLYSNGGKKSITTDNAQRAMSYLRSKGMNHVAASAIVGTLQAESGMNPAIHAQMKGDSGEGLAQWTGSRKNLFWSTLEKIEPGARKKYGSIVKVPLERQLDVVMAERPDITFAINNAKNIQTATDLMLRGYENGGGNINTLASKGQMNSIYGKWNNGYDRQFNTRLGYAKNLLNDSAQYTISQDALDAVNKDINDMDLSKLSSSGLPLLGVPGMANPNPAKAYTAPTLAWEESEPKAPIAEFKYDPQDEKLDNMRTMSNVFGMMGIENPFMDTFRQVDSYRNNPLMAIANMSAYGGKLYADGGEKDSITAKPSRQYSLKNNILGQQTVYKDGDEYYALDENNHRIPLTRDGEWGNSSNPSTWQFKDANGRTYSPQGTHYGESIIPQEKGLVDAPMTLKAINGLLGLPFEGLSYATTGDGLQHNLPEEGDALLETALLTAPVKEVGPIGKKIKGKLGVEPKYEAIIKEEPSAFKSSLDWSPEGWFGTRTGNIGYNLEDVEALKSHIPEYLQIEQQAKANGTWLKMPDGSTWEGDPRSWVQLMSKDGSKFQKRIMYHGDDNFYLGIGGKDMTPEVLGSKTLWTSTNKHLPVTYGSNHYQLTIPKETPNIVFDADGRFWNNLSAPSSYKYRNTNDVSLDLLKDDNTVNINNVVDVGANPRWKPGEKGIPSSLPTEKLYDYYDRVFKGDDIILGKNVPRKSLLGNNGNFDLLNKNIYKGLIPFVLYDFASQKNQ